MNGQYQWQISFDASGPLAAGILEGDPSVHTTSATSGTSTAKYYFIDSNVNTSTYPWEQNNSRVVVEVLTSWTASMDARNNLTINASTVIASIVRDNVVGNPTRTDLSGRNMNAYHYEGGQSLWYYHDTNIAQAKTIATNINLGSWSFTLAPGIGDNKSTMYFFNKNDTYQTQGDRLYLGVKFTNIMPPDYRPGATLDSGSLWQSHNRDGGKAHILDGNGKWIEMRTVNGHTENGNPPSIRLNDKWANQLKLGKE